MKEGINKRINESRIQDQLLSLIVENNSQVAPIINSTEKNIRAKRRHIRKHTRKGNVSLDYGIQQFKNQQQSIKHKTDQNSSMNNDLAMLDNSKCYPTKINTNHTLNRDGSSRLFPSSATIDASTNNTDLNLNSDFWTLSPKEQKNHYFQGFRIRVDSSCKSQNNKRPKDQERSKSEYFQRSTTFYNKGKKSRIRGNIYIYIYIIYI